MRSEKIAIRREVGEQIDAARYLFVVEYGGMKMEQLEELRKTLRKENARFRVFKNTFLRHAVAQRKSAGALEGFFSGMTAVVFGEDDPVATARSLRRFHEVNKTPVLRGGFLEDHPLTAVQIAELASLPSREQLLSRVVGTLAAPMAGLVGVLSAVQSQLVRVLKAIEEKKKDT